MKTLTCTLVLSLLASSCAGPSREVTARDTHGNYATTSDYRAMQRTEFRAAMRAGLADYDERVDMLRDRANKLGGDVLSEFSDWQEDLAEKRVTFVNELERTEAVLAENWPDQREATLESYYEMRECLDEAYEEVLEG